MTKHFTSIKLPLHFTLIFTWNKYLKIQIFMLRKKLECQSGIRIRHWNCVFRIPDNLWKTGGFRIPDSDCHPCYKCNEFFTSAKTLVWSGLLSKTVSSLLMIPSFNKNPTFSSPGIWFSWKYIYLIFISTIKRKKKTKSVNDFL